MHLWNITVILFAIIFSILIQWCIIEAQNDYEGSWIHAMGNPCNTRRLIPSISTNFTNKSWHFIYNSSSQAMAIQGTGVGINGDLYIFISETLSHSADYLLCLTSNGIIRWKLYLEPIPDMINTGVSNIIAPHSGQVFFISSWSKNVSYSGKACRISNGQTNRPILECVENKQLYQPLESPLSINDGSIYLFTTVINESIAVINTTSLEVVWIDRGVIGCSTKSIYNSDGTGIYWIGNDDHFRKVNGADTRLVDVYINSGGNRYYSFDRESAIVTRVWQNFSSMMTTGSLIVSGWDAHASGDFHLLWQWHEPYESSAQSTQPVADDQQGITYIAVLPYLYAINQYGSTIWQVQITSQDEIERYNLVSSCLALNTETKIAFIVVSSSTIGRPGHLSALFVARVHVDTTTVLNRINIDVPSNAKITAHCPILIGNEVLYMSWLLGTYPDLVPLHIIGLPQLDS